MKNNLLEIIENLPKTFGVYIYKDKKDKIIYIGKSINLRARVNSYFNGKSKLNFAKQKMVDQIEKIEYIETKNEVEALILETNLIKTNKPKYNILMKDDKNLTYIKITQDPIPEIIKTRIRSDDGLYFGPFTSTSNVYNTIELVKKLFHLRTCHIKFGSQNKKLSIISKAGIQNIPCMYYYIGQCSGPCLLKEENINEYQKNIELAIDFLKGNTAGVIKNLEEKMNNLARDMKFEEASKIRDELKSLKEIGEKQLAREIIAGNNDIIVTLNKYDKFFVGLLEIRNSQITSLVCTKIENNIEETLDFALLGYLQNRYIENNIDNISIITNEKIEDIALLEYFKSRKIKIENPSIGPKIDILNFTKNNLLNFAYKDELASIGKKTLSKTTQLNIMSKLGLEPKNKNEIIFECYDISHLGGTNTVASRSVIINGKSVNSKYKKYKLKTISSGEIDDFKSMEEIMERRTLEANKLDNWPDLIIIDGGKGQLSSAIKSIQKNQPSVIPTHPVGSTLGVKVGIQDKLYSSVISSDNEKSIKNSQHFCHSLEKGNPEKIDFQNNPGSPGQARGGQEIITHEQIESIQNQNLHPTPYTPYPINICSIAKREEEIFVPEKSEPIIFEKGSAELMLFQKIRDEAHRFAINFNREKRIKDSKKNILEEIPGFGPKSRQKLLKLAGSIDNISSLSEQELSSILSKNQIEDLKNYGII